MGEPSATAPEGAPTHKDLMAQLERGFAKLQTDFNTQALVIQGIQKSVGELTTGQNGLIKSVGEETVLSSGERIGTGIVGRVITIEKRDQADDDQRKRWISRLQGAFWAIAALVPLLWWLTQPDLERIFRAPRAQPQPPAMIGNTTP